MKNIVVIVIVILGAAYYLYNKDPFPKTIYFLEEEYKLGEDTGKKDIAKTYQYTKSGNISGLNDYVQIIVINKTLESDQYAEPIMEGIFKKYNLKAISGLNGNFGIFKVSSEQRNFYAYSIRKETASAHWLLNFVIQSNFGKNEIKVNEARNNASKYIRSLDDVYNSVSY